MFDSNTRQSVLVLLLPGPTSTSLVLRVISSALNGLKSLQSFSEIYQKVNEAVFSSYMGNWRDYMHDFETQLREPVRMIQEYVGMTVLIQCPQEDSTVQPRVSGNSLTLESLKLLQYLHGLLIPMESALANMELTISLLRKIESEYNQPAQVAGVRLSAMPILEASSVAIQGYRTNASALLKRWTATVDMVNNSLSLEQNQLVMALGSSTASDSASIHVITIITLIFLCFSVVAVSLIVEAFASRR